MSTRVHLEPYTRGRLSFLIFHPCQSRSTIPIRLQAQVPRPIIRCKRISERARVVSSVNTARPPLHYSFRSDFRDDDISRFIMHVLTTSSTCSSPRSRASALLVMYKQVGDVQTTFRAAHRVPALVSCEIWCNVSRSRSSRTRARRP